MDRDKAIKNIIEQKKELILKAFKNRLTYEKWDKHSPIWAYSYVFDDQIEKITDVKRIEFLLKQPRSIFVNYFSNMEDLETYKWLFELIGNEVNNAIFKGFKSSVDSFVNVEDFAIGDKNICHVRDLL